MELLIFIGVWLGLANLLQGLKPEESTLVATGLGFLLQEILLEIWISNSIGLKLASWWGPTKSKVITGIPPVKIGDDAVWIAAHLQTLGLQAPVG